MAMEDYCHEQKIPGRLIPLPQEISAGCGLAWRMLPGAFNKVIQVYSNSVDGRDVITVQGNSIDKPERGKVKIKSEKLKIKN